MSLNYGDYGSCTPPTDLTPNDPNNMAYSPGKLVGCTKHEDLPWNNDKHDSTRISCYSPKCQKIIYTSSKDSTAC